MRPTTGPTRKDGVKQKHSVFRNSSQPPKVNIWKKNNATRNVCSGDVYKPRRPGDSSHRTAGAGRGDSAGLGQVSLKVSLSFICNNTFKLWLTSQLFSFFNREIVGHKRIVQNNKQLLSSLRRKARDRDLAPYRWEIFPRVTYHPIHTHDLAPYRFL